ncbi:MAG: hypothetical protein J6Y21_10895 [Clostridia bacterium]|nr:hypothetical protein [Clostridia bacterium]
MTNLHLDRNEMNAGLFVSLHDVTIKKILCQRNGFTLVLEDGFCVVKAGIVFHPVNCRVKVSGVHCNDYNCRVVYGKPSARGEMCWSYPISLRELATFLKEQDTVVQLYQEKYDVEGLLWRANLPCIDDIGGNLWRHIVIESHEIPKIEYFGVIETQE